MPRGSFLVMTAGLRGAAAEGERRRRAAWKERARGARSAAGDTGKGGRRQVAQRGEGYRAFGSTSGGKHPYPEQPGC